MRRVLFFERSLPASLALLERKIGALDQAVSGCLLRGFLKVRLGAFSTDRRIGAASD